MNFFASDEVRLGATVEALKNKLDTAKMLADKWSIRFVFELVNNNDDAVDLKVTASQGDKQVSKVYSAAEIQHMHVDNVTFSRMISDFVYESLVKDTMVSTFSSTLERATRSAVSANNMLNKTSKE